MLKWGSSLGLWIIVGLSLALALTMRIEQGRLATQRAHGAQVALALVNAEASRDSTRVLVAASRVMSQLLGDSVRVYRKRVVQVTQQKDALDKAIGDERVAHYALTGTVDSLERVTQALPNADSAEFHLRSVPYTVDASVVFPPLPDSARMSMRVALDPIQVDARVTCGKPDTNGIRAASVLASTPRWASVTFGRVEQSPDLCPSPALVRTSNRKRFLGFEPLVIGGGRVITPDGRGAWGFFAGSGVHVWN
jgi:hypothetical protein